MNAERTATLQQRAAVYAALADPTRLQVVDVLTVGDAASSELSSRLGTPSNLLAHHLKILEGAGVVERRRSEGDRRRSYWRLVHGVVGTLVGPLTGPALKAPGRVVFVCTANTARSHLAAALWRATSDIPVTSAGTHPGDRIARGALATAGRHGLDLPDIAPRRLDEIGRPPRGGDLLITVCDRAHEDLAGADDLHWSVPDPAAGGTRAAFDRVHDELADRIRVTTPLLRRAS
ncbi:protein-tyrosine-phosphatase [Nocardioides aromaticivorans]|uniref:Protein-tyrosine-phosphatase n=1 Tax=Nocardioides aromaticivorans TaxID=200618 RepID=A0A7Y9ZGS7_9ACTN|nr:helix-turn-helix domain-containing protein [Nocardioides aromaticivorans]NYI45174.1 protein-tyrosine-phosphatase [Nocardioides aromaticivorans]